MKVPKHQDRPQTAEEARQQAIEWQNWQSDKDLSMGVIAQWGAYFAELGKKFNLTDEFKENGII